MNPEMRGLWTNYSDMTVIYNMAFDSKNNLWTVGSGGVETWNRKDQAYRKIRVDEPLAGGGINDLLEGSDGAMWFATSAGVARFDGEQWFFLGEDNPLAGNPVSSIARDPDGSLWFGRNGGVIKYDGANWTSYTEADGLLDNSIQDIAVNKQGIVWVASSLGVSRFDGQTWKVYREEDYGSVFMNGGPTSLAIAPDGSVWGALWAFGVIHIQGDKLSAYGIGQSYTRFGPFIDSIGVGSDGKLWVSTQDSGIFWFDGYQWSNFTRVLGISDPYDGSFCGGGPILSGPDGAVWIGNSCFGVIRYDGKWWHMNYNDGLRQNEIASIAVADDNSLWFATDYRYVSRFDGKYWKTYGLLTGSFFTESSYMEINVVAAGSNGDVWVGGESDSTGEAGGLTRIHGGDWSTFTSEKRPGTENILSIVKAPDGAMWFGSAWNGVWRYDGKSWKQYTTADGLAGEEVNGMTFDSNGILWLATNKGVSRYDGSTWKTYTVKDNLPSDRISAVGIDLSGNVWIVTDDTAAYFDGNRWTTAFKAEFIFPTDGFVSIASGPDGSMWFGTKGERYSYYCEGNGAYRYRDGQLTVIRPWEGLVGGEVRSIAVGPDGAMWFATNCGVARFDWANSPF